jgi:hypothetical protein
VVTALSVVVVLAVVGWAARAQVRQQRARDRADDDLAARAATGDADAVRALGGRLTLGRPGDCQRTAAAARRHLTSRMAPAIATGLAKGEPRVADACAVMLEELGAPGMRAAWSLYAAGAPEPGRDRLRALLLRNPDFLAHELFELWAAAGGQGEPPHADLWRDAGLRQHLRALRDMGDPHVVPLAESLLRRLDQGQPEAAPAAR